MGTQALRMRQVFVAELVSRAVPQRLPRKRGYLVHRVRRYEGDVMLGLGWDDAKATIVSRRLIGKSTEPDMGEFANQGVEVYEYIADIRPADGSPTFRAKLADPHIAITWKAPEIGQVVEVKFNPKNRHVRFDRDDPGTYQHVPGLPDWRRHDRDPLKEADEKAVADAHSDEAESRWNQLANDVPGSPPPE
jgi:hypothetical protein